MDCDIGMVESKESNMALFLKKSCPNEAEMLAYRESQLPAKKRSEIEKHLASCDDCRESLALFSGLELNDPTTESRGIVIADSAVNEQVLRVLDLIEKDEREYSAEPVVMPQRGFKSRWLAIAAMLTVAVGVGTWSISNLGGRVAADEAIAYLAQAQSERGVSDARPSGLSYVSPSGRRGDGDASKAKRDNYIGLAQKAMKELDQKSASAKEKLAYARVLLFSSDADGAVKILKTVVDSERNSAEAENDLGVAYFELTKYELAMESFKEALAINPEMEEALFNRAVTADEIAKAADPRKAELDAAARALLKEFIDSPRSDPKSVSEATDRLNRLGGSSN